MKLSLNWLKDYVDPRLSTDELVHRLTMAGLEVEAVESAGKDTVLELEITPNRPDCLNTIGLAREISAITAKNLKLPRIKTYRSSKTGGPTVSIEDKKDCPRYIATLIRNASILDSPGWLKERISAIGLKPLNNAVDITNFVLMELGQPLHAFDHDKLEGGRIIVRRSKAGEKITTLDGIERKLDPSVLVIADARKPVAIAGIMGGLGSQITSSTKNILLESAQFDMGLVRRASRMLGLKSDSSYRFERGVDLEGVLTGADRATDLLLELTRGTFENRTDINAARKTKHAAIDISLQDIEGLLGTKVSAAQVKNALARLGLSVAAGKKGRLKIAIPGFRGDLKQEVDIIEEVARTIGYDRLAVSFPHIQVANIAPDSRPRKAREAIAQALAAQGYCEAITYSLINQKDLDQCGFSGPAAALQNALSQEHNLLRPTLLPSLLQAALTNINRGQRDLKLFETGKRYSKDGKESWTLAVLAAGRAQQVGFHHVKGALEAAFRRLNADVVFEPGTYAGLDAAACANIKLSGRPIGAVGKVDRRVLTNWDIKTGEAYFAEVDLQAFGALPLETRKYGPVPEFPAIHRDVSIAVKNDVPYARIEALCRQQGGQMLQGMHLIEEYTGEKIQSGLRGLVFSLVYQSPTRTLREEEVNAAHQKVLQALTRDCGAILR